MYFKTCLHLQALAIHRLQFMFPNVTTTWPLISERSTSMDEKCFSVTPNVNLLKVNIVIHELDENNIKGLV